MTDHDKKPNVELPPSVLRLVETLRVQTKSGKDTAMAAYLWQQIGVIPETTTIAHAGNLYVTKGKAATYPCVIAHMDTVHDLLPEDEFEIYIDRGHLFGWNEKKNRWEGSGGDDKVGVWIALEALAALPAVKIAFFRDEEWGCQGSAKADLSFFNDVTLVLQADRRGNGDFVRRAAGTKLFGDEFSDAVGPILARHGYALCDSGAMTDVMKLRDIGLEVASANMSCGYYEPHTHREYVVIEDAEDARDLVFEVLAELGHQTWEWKKPRVVKVARWPTVPDKHLDTRYGKAVVSGVCPGCRKSKVLFWDDDAREWWCSDCELWLPSVLKTLGPPPSKVGAWSDEARASLYTAYETVAIQSGNCLACNSKDTLAWSMVEADYFCAKCGRSLEKIIQKAVEETALDLPKGD